MTTKKIIPNILYLFHKGSFFELLDDYMIIYILFFNVFYIRSFINISKGAPFNKHLILLLFLKSTSQKVLVLVIT